MDNAPTFPSSSAMRLLVAAFLLATTATAGVAQPAIIRPGVHVRIDAPGVTVAPTEAFILSMTPDSITIGDDKLAPLAVPRVAIKSLELGSGKDHWRGTAKGTLIGMGWGAGLGVIAAFTGEDCYGAGAARSCNGLTGREKVAAVGLVSYVGAFYGAIIGAIVGSERWDKVELPTHPVTGLHNGSPSLSWTLSF